MIGISNINKSQILQNQTTKTNFIFQLENYELTCTANRVVGFQQEQHDNF